MNQTDDLFAQAQKLHEKGLIKQAEPLYLKVLQAEPAHEEALFWLASIYTNLGRHQDAVPLYYRALELNPADAETYTGLGICLSAAGQAAEAETNYRLALDLKPNAETLHYYLGGSLFVQARYAEAEAAFRQALKLKPNFPEAQRYLQTARLKQDKGTLAAKSGIIERKPMGTQAPSAAVRAAPVNTPPVEAESAGRMVYEATRLAQQGQYDPAFALYQKAIALDPDFMAAYYNWGTILLVTGKLAAAVPLLEKALALEPDNVGVLTNLGSVFAGLKEFQRSEEIFRRAAQIAPGDASVWTSLAATYLSLMRIPEALETARQAIELDPDLPLAQANLGGILMESGQIDAALEYCRNNVQANPDRAENLILLAKLHSLRGEFAPAREALEQNLRLRPNDQRAQFELAFLNLLSGNFAEGWRNYRAIYEISENARRPFGKPEWTGQTDPNATVLVHIHQGIGDCIQFLRYLAPLKQRVGRIVLETTPATRALYENNPNVAALIQTQDEAQREQTPYDYHVSTTVLAGLFWDECGPLASAVPYIAADAQKAAKWKTRFADEAGFKAGIVWAGSAGYVNDHIRSAKLAHFAPLGSVPNVRLYSLQKGEAAAQAAFAPAGMTLVDLADELEDFGNTAAVIANLDLVISVDTSAVHLAGAMGRPVWTLLPFVPEWRWGRDSEVSVWYPSMRLIRAEAFHGWEAQLQTVARQLDALVNGKTASS